MRRSGFILSRVGHPLLDWVQFDSNHSISICFDTEKQDLKALPDKSTCSGFNSFQDQFVPGSICSWFDSSQGQFIPGSIFSRFNSIKGQFFSVNLIQSQSVLFSIYIWANFLSVYDEPTHYNF